MTFFLPITSANFPESGRESKALIEKSVMINPLLEDPPISEMKVFISGRIKLNPRIKKKIENEILQKFAPRFSCIFKCTIILTEL